MEQRDGAGIETPPHAARRICYPDYMLVRLVRQFGLALLIGLGLAAHAAAAQQPKPRKPAKAAEKAAEDNSLAHQIRHQIRVLPYYSVFDYITFTLNGDKVTLTGRVLRPSLRKNAEAAMQSLEGVRAVDNQIELLPKSPVDDDTRRAVYRSIYEDSALQRYAVSEIPSIHIIVRDGAVFLEGFVASDADKSLATVRAAGASGVSSVKNNLAVRNQDASSSN